MTKVYTESQIKAQREILKKSPLNAMYYERGRLDRMLGEVVPPPASRTEITQWEMGWRDENFDNERPY